MDEIGAVVIVQWRLIVLGRGWRSSAFARRLRGVELSWDPASGSEWRGYVCRFVPIIMLIVDVCSSPVVAHSPMGPERPGTALVRDLYAGSCCTRCSPDHLFKSPFFYARLSAPEINALDSSRLDASTLYDYGES